MFHVRFQSTPSRGLLSRMLAVIVAVVAIAAGLALGFFTLLVIVCVGLLFLAIQFIRSMAGPRRRPASASSGVIEGEFSVVDSAGGKPIVPRS